MADRPPRGDRGLPHSWEAEQALLGGLLLAPERLGDVRAVLEPDHYHRPAHQELYRLILALHDQGAQPDLLVVVDEIERTGDPGRLGGIAYIAALPQKCPSVDALGGYARRVREHADRRDAILRARGLEESIRSGAPTDLTALRALGADPLEEWDTPVKLEEGTCRVAFPVSVLPADLAWIVSELATAFQVPADLPAALALGLLGGACGRARALAWEGWDVPLPLWTCVVLRPGARKSPVLAVLRAPVDEHERELRTAARDRAEADRAVLRGQLAEAGRDPELRAPLEQRLRDLDGALPPTVLTSGDDTPEALVELLAANPAGITIASAEGVAFQHMTGLYREGGANLDVYLKGHGAERVSVHRRGRSVEAERPLLSVALAIQPHVLAEARANRALAGRGILQRFLWALPRDGIGYRATDPRPLPPSLGAEWRGLYRRTAERAAQAPALALAPDALEVFLGWRGEHERALRDLPDTLLEWSSKADGYALRLAGILQLTADTGPITAPALRAALALVAYFGAHARTALVASGADPATRLAERILRWLIRDPLRPTFTEREAHAAVKADGVTVEHIRRALGVLEEHGYLRRCAPPLPTGPGRPPSPTWAINPEWDRAN